MDKNKLILPITILLASIILGGFIYASQLSKQQSIEKQQQIDLQAKAEQDKSKQRTEQMKIEQDKKEYIAKRKKDCYEIYEKEREKFNNVENFGYVETYNMDGTSDYRDDTCEVIYKNKEWKENDPNSCDWIDSLADEKTCTIERYFRKYF